MNIKPQTMFTGEEPYEESSNWVKNYQSYKEKYKPHLKGKLLHDVWKMPAINNMAKERTRYPTQKPLKLLSRIIKASSNPGDVVLDPFCGCATACVATQDLNRKWIGIDISEKAVELVLQRFKDELKILAPNIIFAKIYRFVQMVLFVQRISNTRCLAYKRGNVMDAQRNLNSVNLKLIT